jgi:hypothetical protein
MYSKTVQGTLAMLTLPGRSEEIAKLPMENGRDSQERIKKIAQDTMERRKIKLTRETRSNYNGTGGKWYRLPGRNNR